MGGGLVWMEDFSEGLRQRFYNQSRSNINISIRIDCERSTMSFFIKLNWKGVFDNLILNLDNR